MSRSRPGSLDNADQAAGPVAIVGVGLIGGSLGLALRARAGVAEVRGFDTDEAALRRAVALGAITRPCGTLGESVGGASTVVLAAPVSRLGRLAGEALVAAGGDCVVTDVGSTKANVLAALSGPGAERFIGGHPICGSERGGVENAREELFEGATWFLTPTADARPDLFERLHGLVAAVGARPVAIDAEVHDRLMALVSHLPHVIASTLIHQAAATAPQGREALRSAGPSFADLTRVAGANPRLWSDILVENRAAVSAAIDEQVTRLREVRDAVSAADREWLATFMERAAGGRARLRQAGADVVEEPWRLVVAMPNRPGVISEIATVLGHAHINIEDLSLQRGAGEEVGELSLLVAGAATAQRARELLGERGYSARVEPLAE